MHGDSIHARSALKAAPDRMRSLVALQGAFILLALLASLLTPRPGKAVLLMPVWAGRDGMAGMLRLSGADAAIVGTGRIYGSLIIFPRKDVPIMSLIIHGVLPITVPASLCANLSETPGQVS